MNHKNKGLAVLVLFAVIMTLFGCHQEEIHHTAAEDACVITDSLGNQAQVKQKARVVCLYGSYAECWQLSGGTLVGVTEDAVEERHMALGDDTAVVGTVKEPNLEKIIAQRPDYVILSADLSAHQKLKNSLENLGIPCGYFRVDSFVEYKAMMQQFCRVNHRDDLYEKNVTQVENRIEAIKEKIPQGQEPSVLLMRAFSTGVKAKKEDNLAGKMIKELGCHNIADDFPSLLENLSVEEVVKQDPDYILVMTMGDEDDAKSYMKNNIENNPAWKELSAVKEGHYVFLPKELFHYKPNNRWDESYEYLAKIFYPDFFA